MADVVWKKRASALSNGDFICVESYSGYSLALADPKAPEHLLAPNTADEVLGEAILNALEHSRFLPIEEARELRMSIETYYKNWITKMQSRYGYKTKNALFKKMMNCGISLDKNEIIFSPRNHEKLEGWGDKGIRETDYVRIPADTPPAEIGAALRLAFSRCLGPKP